MVAYWKTFGMLSLAAMVAVALGCSRRPSRIHPPAINAQAAGQAAMEEYDTNKDGKVADDELAKAPSLKEAVKEIDKDGDKAITAEEVTARILHWQESKTALMTMTLSIRFHGRPLPDAKVVLEPEKFLGENVKAAEGVSDQFGTVSLGIPGSELPGMAPGLYKVRITSDKVKIPPQYNEQTTLGIEVANDAKGMETGMIPIDIK